MSEQSDDFLSGVRVVQIASPTTSDVARRAVDTAGQMARLLGAEVLVDEHFSTENTFVSRGKVRIAQDPKDWLAVSAGHFALVADAELACELPDDQIVVLHADKLASEATLFAESGIADLLGAPDRAPIIPTGSYAAGTVAYGLLAALTALVAMQRRFQTSDQASVNAVGVLAWVNWKAAAAGALGRDICRQGDKAEWPVIQCKDGYAALVFQERDWSNLVAMVSDDRLKADRFTTFKGREENRTEYMEIFRSWARALSKNEINSAFLEFDIPAASVMEAKDLIADPLLQHREALTSTTVGSLQNGLTPQLAHRVVSRKEQAAPEEANAGSLPLSGIRVLDLGIITAGAGVSALLSDLGAEVIKVESHTYPDPFRQWAGQAVSPLFKCNNRNKYAVALDLKDQADKAKFLELVRESDVVVENFRRGVLERLNLGYDTLSSVNPRILLASVSGQGLSGPGCGSSSFGSTLEASSGFSAHITYDDGVPHITGRNVNYPDQTVVLYAAAVITAALSSPLRGMQLDVSQRDVAVFLAGDEIESASVSSVKTGVDNGRAVLSKDDQWVAFAPNSKLIESLSDSSLEAWCQSFEAETLIGKLKDLGIGAAVVKCGSKMYETMRSTEVFGESPDGAMVKGFPFQFATNPMTIRLNSPEVGEHTERFCQ